MGTRRVGQTGLHLILMATVLLAAGMGWAQSVQDATLKGTVYLPTGEALGGATVKVTSAAIVAGERTTVSGDGGRFVFLSLRVGTYDLTVSLPGFKTFTSTGIVLTTGDMVDLKVTLEIGAIEEELIVTSVAPIVDTRSSTIDTTFTEELLSVVPTDRDAFYDLALTAPGMAAVGADGSWLPSPSAYGSAANENLFLVNGVNATNPRGSAWGSLVSVNYNTVEEVKVLALGSKAEYGSFSGAAMDVLTKSGGNEFHFDVAYFSQVGSASDNSTTDFGGIYYADPADDLTTSPETDWEFSITGGGPIVKDRLWFYAGYGTYKTVVDTPLFIPLKEYEADLFDIKLTADLGVSHRAWLGYHHEDVKNGNESWGDTWDLSMIYNQKHDNDTIQGQYQWVVSDHDVFSFKVLAFETNQNPTIPAEVGHPGFINWWKWVGAQSIGVSGDFPYVEAQKSERKTFQADFTHYAEDFLGEHDVKFGVQYTDAEGNWQGGYFQGYAQFAYPYPWDYGPAENWWWNCEEDWCWGTPDDPVFPMYVREKSQNPWLTVRQSDSLGVFVDDTWIISDRVSLNLGLRYDHMTAKYGDGLVYELSDDPGDVANPTVLRTRQGTDNLFDFKTWSPRLGVAWTITEDQKTVLRAHLGRYYAPVGVDSLRKFGPDMQGNHTDTWIHYLPMSEVDTNGNGVIDFDEVRPATRLLDGREPDGLLSASDGDDSWELEVEPDTGSPYTDQFNLSIQRQLGQDVAVELTYVYKKTDDIIALRPYNTETGEFFQWESSPYTTWTGDETKVWQIRLEDYDDNGVVDVDDARFVVDNNHYRAVNVNDFNGQSVDRTYQGLQLVVNKRYANRWQLLGSVNWTNSNGFAPRTVDQHWYIDGPQTQDTPFGSTFNHFQNNTEGPLLMTPEWMAKLGGSYTIPVIETDLGVRWRYDSGRALFPIELIPTYQNWMGEIQDGVYLATNWHEFMVADDPDNNDWLPSTSIWDLSLGKSIGLGKYGEFRISLDVLNALNESSPNRVGYGQGNYGRVYSLVQGRTTRLGVKYSF